jgi:protein farnesyltransferase/geranylgeranyltransferase type-1 subunit alpha
MVTYRDDPEWADVPKIPQDDGPNPVVRILYSERCTPAAGSLGHSFTHAHSSLLSSVSPVKDIMDCFRGVLRLNEFSERTLRLTLDVIDANPANYTAWHFRRQALEALNENLHEELEYTEEMALEHPKNYQIWHHRREICTVLKDGSKEKAFSERAIADDSKNYHAWAHRQWAIRTFALWDGELAYIDELLEADIRNNSAWNQRFFVVKHTTPMAVEDRQREIDYAFAKIAIAPHNESPWNYVRGMVRGHERVFAEQLREKCNAVLAEHAQCVFAAALLVDVYASDATEAAVTAALEVRASLLLYFLSHC